MSRIISFLVAISSGVRVKSPPVLLLPTFSAILL